VEVPLVENRIGRGFKQRVEQRMDNLHGVSVLVIDNEADIQAGMQSLLENWECRVMIAGSYRDAHARIEATGILPEAIVADYHLDNGETGMMCLSALKRDFETTIPALIITADQSDEVRAEIMAQGYGVLRKPLKPAKLRAWLSHVVTQNGG
jgi:CheY-like chemotaxis protein